MDDRDRDLIQRASTVPGDGSEWLSRRAFAELIIDLRDTVRGEMKAANALTERIHVLNRWLLWYTVALAVIAALQLGAWFREITR